jgi:hypothetical protein
MSPKRITQLALTVAVVSIGGIGAMVVIRPAWGLFNWWPAMGIGLALLLVVVAYTRGAMLAAQKRIDLIDALNDCYAGVPEKEGTKT